MTSVRDDLVKLSDYAWGRLRDRMDGLADAEYLWEPVPNCRTVRPVAGGTYRSDGPARAHDPRQFTTLAWRLAHIVSLLQEERNGPWLGQPARPPDGDGDPGTAAAALTALERAYAEWRSVLDGTTDESLAEPIGAVAGPYSQDTRRAFVLHVLDELIHHGAEAALLRDLYRASDLAK
jgi:uncharacterized damage-inducible protein DinB